MIITKDFVFVHMPKTGGTFVHGIFKKIVANYKKNHPVKWYLNRLDILFLANSSLLYRNSKAQKFPLCIMSIIVW